MTLTIKINKSGPFKSGVSKRVHKGQIPNIVYGLTQSDPTRHVTYAVASQHPSMIGAVHDITEVINLEREELRRRLGSRLKSW